VHHLSSTGEIPILYFRVAMEKPIFFAVQVPLQ